LLLSPLSSPHMWHKQIDDEIILRARWHAKSHHYWSIQCKGHIFKVHKSKYGMSSTVKGNKSIHNISPPFMSRKESYLTSSKFTKVNMVWALPWKVTNHSTTSVLHSCPGKKATRCRIGSNHSFIL